MKDIITLYNDGDKEVHYYINKINRECDFVSVIRGDGGVDYPILNDILECHKCYDHIMSIINDKRYAECICECISAIVNDWFEDYIQMPVFADIKMHILDLNNEQLNK